LEEEKRGKFSRLGREGKLNVTPKKEGDTAENAFCQKDLR